MSTVRWNELKNKRLKLTRGVSFEEILQAEFLGIRENPSRENQFILVFKHKGYLWAVPFIIAEDHIFLKTLYPSRKDVKVYKRRLENEKNKIDQRRTMD